MSETRSPLSEQIFVRLRDRILTGQPPAGDALPSERALSEELGVNRHAVREAIKRLQQAQLVQVSHGGATRVLDWRRHGGLDLLAHLPLVADGAPAPALLRSLVEMRLCIGVDAARRCAERAPQHIVAELKRASDAGRGGSVDDAAAHLRYAQLWDHIVDGADNVAYRLAYNSLLASLDPLSDLAVELFSGEARDHEAHAELIEAIAAGDPDAAAGAAHGLLARAGRVVLEHAGG